MNVIKRNGKEVGFDRNKIEIAVTKAKKASGDKLLYPQWTAKEIEKQCKKLKRAVDVEEIQNMVELCLMKHGYYETAQHYIRYRYKRELVRQSNTTDKQILSLLKMDNEEAKQENANKNPIIVSTQRDYMAGEVSKDISKRFLLPDNVVEAHEKGIIHFHDLDYFSQPIHNCCLINLEDMLQNGTNISGIHIDKPHSFSTACTIATQIIAQVASSQYGGQTISLAHLAPFVDISRQSIRDEVVAEYGDGDLVDSIVEERLKKEITKGIQTIQYQVITLMTTNGQAPFVSVNMDINEAKNSRTQHDLAMIIEEMLKQRIKGVKNEKGVYITPAFPKLLYVLDENNIHPESEYFYLTELAAKCTAKRMVPDYISAKKMREYKLDKAGNGNVYPCMGCRSFLTPYVDDNGTSKYYGRFNQGVVTLNLVDVACSAEGNLKRFWELLDERLKLCHEALMCRHKHLEGTVSDVAPILWQNGALARLKKGETIDKLLHDGYSTISLGYAGLAECVYRMLGVSHTTEEGKRLGIQILTKLNDACAVWKSQENVDFSVYGTPIESTTYRFAKCLQKRFGIIPHVTDKNYITNSYHVHVTEPIDAFTKLTLESEFQKLSPGGAISYVEVPNLQKNIPAVLAVINHIYNNIMYAELNTKSDYCQVCGYEGEIEIVENEQGKLIWKCPNCHNNDIHKMNVARRVCGYISTNEFNQGRTQEIKERVLHL